MRRLRRSLAGTDLRGDFDFFQFGEDAVLPACKPPPVLHAETHEQRSPAVVPVHDLTLCFQVAVENRNEAQFLPQIAMHGIGHAVVQALDEWGRVKIAVKSGGCFHISRAHCDIHY